jgi:hypothetical protein
MALATEQTMADGILDRTVIGAVEYRISDDEGVITARYVSSGSLGQAGVVCRGRAVGDTSNGFPGDYQISYFGVDGQSVGEFDWHIEAVDQAFRLTWRNRAGNAFIPAEPGDVVFEGFGFSNTDRSIVVTYWMVDKVASPLFAAATGS